MAIIKPFCGLRPAKGMEFEVSALPYDVLSVHEAREIKKTKKWTFLQVEKPEIDFSDNTDPNSDEVHKKGAQNLKKMVDNGIMTYDKTPSFYLYKQVMGTHSQIGLVGGASVEEYNNDVIKKHEHTRKDKEDERTNHVNILNANTGPVFLTYPHRDEIDNFVNKLTKKVCDVDFVSDDGISHTLWVVNTQEDINELIKMFKKIPALYVADGHHRSAAATRVCALRRTSDKEDNPDKSYNYFLSVIFPDNQMNIMAYNRVLKDLNNYSAHEILTKLNKIFSIEKLDVKDPEEAKPRKRGDFSIFLNHIWYLLTIKPELIPLNDPVNSLDVAILQNKVLNPIFGIENPRTDKRIDFVGGIRGMRELVKRCENDCKVAFALFPTTINQLIDVANAGKVMPPKSTWFEPKLRSGLFVRSLD